MREKSGALHECGGGERPERAVRQVSGWHVPGRAARGLRAAGGGLANGRGFRCRAPRLSGHTATSGDGSRRPGMAAWSPAAAAPLLRQIRRVSGGKDRVLPPGWELRQGRGRGFPFLSFIQSLICPFSGTGQPAFGEVSGPGALGTSLAGWRWGENRHLNSHKADGTGKALSAYRTEHGTPSPESRRGCRALCRGRGSGTVRRASLTLTLPQIPRTRCRSPTEDTHHALS